MDDIPRNMIYIYSVGAVLGLCVIVFLVMLFQKKREEEKKRKRIEFISSQNRVSSARNNLNTLRKKMFEVENKLADNSHFYKMKKEELIQLVKIHDTLESEKTTIEDTIKNGVPENELNLLTNRLKLLDEQFTDKTQEITKLQEEINDLEINIRENEQLYEELVNQNNAAEKELEDSKQELKIKEQKFKS